jgi:prepilin-type N-terminal cleavage/methylation domain-containing protein
MMRHGFTLLEVLVAATILVVSLAAIFRLMSGSQRQSQRAAELADVQLVCQSTMAELIASDKPITPQLVRPVNTVRNWQFYVTVTPAATPNSELQLMTVCVTARKTNDPTLPPFELQRWVAKQRTNQSSNEQQYYQTSPFDLPQSPIGMPFQMLVE